MCLWLLLSLVKVSSLGNFFLLLWQKFVACLQTQHYVIWISLKARTISSSSFIKQRNWREENFLSENKTISFIICLSLVFIFSSDAKSSKTRKFVSAFFFVFLHIACLPASISLWMKIYSKRKSIKEEFSSLLKHLQGNKVWLV